MNFKRRKLATVYSHLQVLAEIGRNYEHFILRPARFHARFVSLFLLNLYDSEKCFQILIVDKMSYISFPAYIL
jgi:hypothetical protein